MKKFEYDVVDIEFSNQEELKNELQKRGLDGWELCGETKPSTSMSHYNIQGFILKREIKEK